MVSNSPAPSPGANSSCQSFAADLPAFPCPGINSISPGDEGLTKRELFAALAMQGLLASQALAKAGQQQQLAQLALNAVRQADTVLAALEAPNYELMEGSDE